MKKIFFVFFLLFLFIKVNAQFVGTVLNKQTNEPISFADIYFKDLKTGTTTDKNGKFTINHYNQKTIHIIISYIGFKTIDTILNLDEITKKTFYLETEHLNLDEIIISVPTGKLQQNAVVSISHVKLANLQKIPSVSLAESISNIAGVDQNTTGSGIGKPVIRGLSGNRIVTYAQGIRIENQQWGGEHGLGVGDIGIESVEVIKGPASLLYGADALGGVLYFVDERYAKHNTYQIGLQSEYLSNSLGYLNNIKFKVNKGNLKFNIFGAYNTNADYQIPNKKRVEGTRFDEKNIKTSLGFNHKNWISNFRYSYLANTFGITEGAIYTNNSDRKFELPFQKITNHNISFENKFTLTNQSKLNTVLGYTSNFRKEFEYDKNNPALGLLLNTFSYNLKWHSTLVKDIYTFVLGSQGMHQTNKNSGEEILIPNATTNDFGIYALGNAEINQFHFQGGIRFDQRKINAKQTENISSLKEDYSGITFSTGLVYRKEKSKTRINISNGFRAPTTSELLSDGVHEGTNRYEKGNKNLKNETATQIDFSYSHRTEHFNFFVNPFYNYIKNYIFLEPSNVIINNNPVYNYTQKDAYLYGGELGFHYHPHQIHWLHLESNIATVFAEDKNKNPLPLIPQTKTNTTISISLKANKKLAIDNLFLQHIYKFSQPRIGLFETETDAYQLINIGFGARLKSNKNTIVFNFGVKNITNQKYIDHLSRFKDLDIPNQGINFYFGVKMSHITKLKQQILK